MAGRTSQHRGTELAIRLIEHLARYRGRASIKGLAETLGIPRSTLYRITRTLSVSELVDISQRGSVAIGPLALRLLARHDSLLQREDANRLAPRPKPPQRTQMAGGGLARHPQSVQTTSAGRYRRPPKYKIGFSNAAIDSPWRTALVHSVEYGAVRHRSLVSALSVRHAAQSALRQAADIEHLLAEGADGLIVSAVSAEAIAPVLEQADKRGIPTVLVDRGLPDLIPHASFVTCDDGVIGRTTALWLAETLRGRGNIVLLPGLAEAEPAQRRLAGAHAIFSRYPGLAILAEEWTGWQRDAGERIMRSCLDRFRDRIDAVWCDSGLQAVGSLKAFLRYPLPSRPVPPHTGGDLNLAYKLAIRHRVPLAAVDYPPAMGLRSIEVLLDLLRGRSVPRRVDVPTETVVTRGHATASVLPDLWAEDHVRWDLPDDLILASGLGVSYDPRSFRIRYRGNRYNRSAAEPPAVVAP